MLDITVTVILKKNNKKTLKPTNLIIAIIKSVITCRINPKFFYVSLLILVIFQTTSAISSPNPLDYRKFSLLLIFLPHRVTGNCENRSLPVAFCRPSIIQPQVSGPQAVCGPLASPLKITSSDLQISFTWTVKPEAVKILKCYPTCKITS